MVTYRVLFYSFKQWKVMTYSSYLKYQNIIMLLKSLMVIDWWTISEYQLCEYCNSDAYIINSYDIKCDGCMCMHFPGCPQSGNSTRWPCIWINMGCSWWLNSTLKMRDLETLMILSIILISCGQTLFCTEHYCLQYKCLYCKQ